MQKINNAKQVPVAFTNTATYSPFGYIPTLVAVVLARIVNISIWHTVLLARIADLITYTAALTGSMLILKKSKVKWLLFATALLPTAVYQASIISVDAMVNSCALVFMALFIKAWFLRRTLTTRETVLLLLLVFILPMTKVNYGILDFCIFLIPNDTLAVKRPLLIKSIVLSVAIVSAGVWALFVSSAAQSLASLAGSGNQAFLMHAHVTQVVHAPVSVVKTFLRTILLQDGNMLLYLFGQMSAAMITAPGISFVSLAIVLSMNLLSSDENRVTTRELYYLFGIVAVGILSIMGVLYLTFSSATAVQISGIQGRYFQPFLAPLLVAGSIVLARKHLSLKLRAEQALVLQNMTYIGVGFSLLLAALKFYYVL